MDVKVGVPEVLKACGYGIATVRLLTEFGRTLDSAQFMILEPTPTPTPTPTKPESTEGGRCVSVLEWQGGAPALLG